MICGTCLCGDVVWEADALHDLVARCHCSRCRKAHGTPLVTWALAAHEAFRFAAGADGIARYDAGTGVVRAFCGRCGASLPEPDPHTGAVAIPMGGIDGDPGARPRAHLFFASRVPWLSVADTLPRFDAYPPGIEAAVVADPPPQEPAPGRLRGGCLCGAVAYEIGSPPRLARFCHCTRCRKARGAAYAANLFAPLAGARFVRGGERVIAYKVPEALRFTQCFCEACGSPLPRLDPERGAAIVPLGSLDDAPGIGIECHIFVASKAPWLEIADALPQHAEYPPV